jgi:hypothetical protein
VQANNPSFTTTTGLTAPQASVPVAHRTAGDNNRVCSRPASAAQSLFACAGRCRRRNEAQPDCLIAEDVVDELNSACPRHMRPHRLNA